MKELYINRRNKLVKREKITKVKRKKNIALWGNDFKRKKERTKIWFCLVWVYHISTIVGYIMPNPFFYLNIKYIEFGLVGLNGIPTIVVYLMPDNFYTYISIDVIYDL